MRTIKNPAQRRYVQRIALSMAAYALTLAVALRFVRDGHMTGPLAYLLGSLPGLSVIGVFWAIGRLLVEETDEFRRLLLVRQILVATGVTLSIVTVWGFLENVGLVQHFDGFYVAVIWFAGLGAGSLFNRVTLGADAGDCT